MPAEHSTPASFFAPREVLRGSGASTGVGVLLERWGVRPGPVLVVRDAVVASLGLGAEMIDSLAANGYTPTMFDGIATEPTLEIARAVLQRARESGATVVIGIGGGSSMDMAKVAATYARETCTIEEIVADQSLTRGVLPLVLIPTTSGTGAETSRVSMLSVDGHKRILISPFFVPLAAVLDPDLIRSLPKSVTASSGLDALSHAFEAFISNNATPLTDGAARAAIRMLATSLPRAYETGSDLDARADTLTAAHLAGWSLNAGVVLGHSIAYTIADRTHLPHGITTGMTLPYALAYSLPRVGDRLQSIANDLPEQTSSSVDGLLNWLRDLEGQLGAPTSLRATGIAESEVSVMAADCIRDYPRPSNPVPLAQGRLEDLLGHFYEGDLAGAMNAMAN